MDIQHTCVYTQLVFRTNKKKKYKSKRHDSRECSNRYRYSPNSRKFEPFFDSTTSIEWAKILGFTVLKILLVDSLYVGLTHVTWLVASFILSKLELEVALDTPLYFIAPNNTPSCSPSWKVSLSIQISVTCYWNLVIMNTCKMPPCNFLLIQKNELVWWAIRLGVFSKEYQ